MISALLHLKALACLRVRSWTLYKHTHTPAGLQTAAQEPILAASGAPMRFWRRCCCEDTSTAGMAALLWARHPESSNKGAVQSKVGQKDGPFKHRYARSPYLMFIYNSGACGCTQGDVAVCIKRPSCARDAGHQHSPCSRVPWLHACALGWRPL